MFALIAEYVLERGGARWRRRLLLLLRLLCLYSAATVVVIDRRRQGRRRSPGRWQGAQLIAASDGDLGEVVVHGGQVESRVVVVDAAVSRVAADAARSSSERGAVVRHVEHGEVRVGQGLDERIGGLRGLHGEQVARRVIGRVKRHRQVQVDARHRRWRRYWRRRHVFATITIAEWRRRRRVIEAEFLA